MSIHLRPITPGDAETCGRIFYWAFYNESRAHGFPPDLPSEDTAIGYMHSFVENPNMFGVVAEDGGKVVGSNFLTESDAIRGVGPVTVDPNRQGRGIGRKLMEAVLHRGRDAAGIRLVQEAFNTASLALYASLGFDVKEPLVLLEGSVRGPVPSGVVVRPLESEDLDACGALCRRVHGIERTAELRQPPPRSRPFVALREGRYTAYASAPSLWPMNHAVAETEEDLRALLLGSAQALNEPLSFLLPSRQANLFRWCLEAGMRVVKPATLMTIGLYQEPAGCSLPSAWY
jgi:ribosomal protein S18 acetylase RimI-like enzyme